MNQFFKKAVVFGDAHFGRNNDSPIANQDNLDFIQWMIDRARAWGAETCIFLGDFYHNRSAIGLGSMQAALNGMEQLSAAGFEKIVFLIGNHDIARRQSRDICSLNFARHIPKIEVITAPTTVGNVTFLPWLLEHEHDVLAGIRSHYVFAHLETIGAMMNGQIACTGGQHAIETSALSQIDQVFTGHFHQRQTLKNFTYIGSIMPFDFGDANDSARGAMLLQWGNRPRFIAWPEQPLYTTGTLSSILDNLHTLKPRMTLRASVDIDMRYEEVQEIRETLIEQYQLRKVELLNVEPSDPSYQPTAGPLHTVDQIVIEGLRSVESALSNDRLIAIFNALPRH